MTVEDDKELTEYLWNIVKEIIKTNIENKQNIIIEGCYIPFDWKKDFKEEYLKEIQYICLIMTEEYIKNNYNDIIKYENVIEKRKQQKCVDIKNLIEEFVLVFALIVIIAGAGFLIMKTGFNIDIQQVNNIINKYGVIILAVFMIIMYYISYKISYKIYSNKEE